MKLKKTNKNSFKSVWANKNFTSKFVFFVLFTCIIFLAGALFHKTGIIGETKKIIIKSALYSIRQITATYKANPEKIFIDIKHKHWQRIAYKREVALNKNFLFSSPDDYVPARLVHGDKEYRVKLRLKGDLSDHWDTDKWSLRIKIKGNDTLFGMKNFSIQHPKTRLYAGEWLAMEAMRREGLIAVRYKFIDVTINGKHKGIYALEEHFEKRLLEHNQYREGPIIKFNEDLFWHEFDKLQTRESDYGTWSSSAIDGYSKDRSNKSQFVQAVTLLEAFRSGKYKTTEVFDGRKLALFIAMKDLFGSSQVDWMDFRFYYNPVTSKLEPIVFDFHIYGHHISRLFSYGGGVKWKWKDWHQNPYGLVPLFFKDIDFYSLYIQALQKISKPEYFEKLLQEVAHELKDNINIIHSEYPDIELTFEAVYSNAEFIRNKLEPAKGIHAYMHDIDQDHVEIEIGAIQSLPVQIRDIVLSENIRIQPTQNTILNAKYPTNPVDYHLISFVLPEGFYNKDSSIPELKVHYSILGTDKILESKIFPWRRINKSFLDNDLVRQKPNIDKFDFLIVDEIAKKIFIRPGVFEISKNMIIPKGYIVVCGPGTNLQLNNSSSIVSFSAVQFHGSQESPIIINSDTINSGQGLVVLSAEGKSELEYVLFNNLSNPSSAGWNLTGAVTFYESPVEISNCQFNDNRSEDSLNIIRSEFIVSNSFFSGAFSDAFDADFSDGRILYSSFENSGNDAIDISGSEVEITSVFMDEIGDKGLSAGENSRIDAKDLIITNAEIAIASKDMSEVIIQNMAAKKCKFGLAVYQKKPEFGPGKISGKNITLTGCETEHIIEKGSNIEIDGISMMSSEENVVKTLYGSE